MSNFTTNQLKAINEPIDKNILVFEAGLNYNTDEALRTAYNSPYAVTKDNLPILY